MHGLPVVMEELFSMLRLLVKEDEGTEVGLLVGSGAEFDFVEVVIVGEVVLARRGAVHDEERMIKVALRVLGWRVE